MKLLETGPAKLLMFHQSVAVLKAALMEAMMTR